MKMEDYEIKKLRDLPIEEVADQLGITVNAHHKAICPFHDDHHASLSFSKKANTCRCFVCMEHSMDTITLTMKLKHVDFIVATRWLAEMNGIELKGMRRNCHTYVRERKNPSYSRGTNDSRSTPSPENPCNPCLKNNPSPPAFDASRYARFFEHPWLSDEARKFLFEERRLDERVVRWCRIASWQDRAGTHWLQIPYFDMQGNLIGMQNRNLDYPRSPTDFTDSTDFKDSTVSKDSTNSKDSTDSTDSTGFLGAKNARAEKAEKPEKPRFRFPYGAKCGIYNLPVINRMKPGDELYITEGCSDCWAMLSAGHKAIAIPSATLLTPEDKVLLAELSQRLNIQWHMYPDRDAPGERLFLQLQELLPSLQHHQLPPGCKDFGEAFVKELKGG